ncbi:MAG: hypothetical protein ABH869_00520 [Candidatus Omnitrophota bacterium]
MKSGENNLVDKFKAFRGTFDRLGYIRKYWNSSINAKKMKAGDYFQSFFGDKTIDLKKVAQRFHYLARQIRDVIEPVTIRRNRLDLQNNPFYMVNRDVTYLHENIWEGSITISYRITYHIEKDTIHLRPIGTHAILCSP